MRRMRSTSATVLLDLLGRYPDNTLDEPTRLRGLHKYLIVNLVFYHLGFWSGNFFLTAPSPDHCLLSSYIFYLSDS